MLGAREVTEDDPDPTEVFVRVSGTVPDGKKAGQPFKAGLIIFKGVGARANPILKWTLGMTKDAISAGLRERGWTATQVRVGLGQLVSLGMDD